MSKKLFSQFKCSRMMLPEHRESLKEHRRQAFFRENYPMPSFDEQQLAEFQLLLNQSIYSGTELNITVLTEKGYLTARGIAGKGDPVSGKISLVTGEGVKKIMVSKIVAITPVL